MAILITMEATVDTMVDTVTVTGINFFLLGVFILYMFKLHLFADTIITIMAILTTTLTKRGMNNA